MAPVKRSRAQTDAPEAKKSRIVDPIAEKVEVIKRTLSDPECEVGGGEAHREMLLASIPHTLPYACDERHEYQTAMAKMVQVVLHAYVADREAKLSDAQVKVDSAEQQSGQALKAVEASAILVQAQEDEVTRCQDVLRNDSEVLKASQESLELATKEVADFDTNLQVTIDEKDRYTSVYNECFVLLKSGSAEKKEASQLLKRIESVLKKLNTESSLLVAVVPALKKAPAERGTFDIMAIDGIEAVFTKHLENLQEQIDKADVLKAEKVAAQGGAQEALDVAKSKEALAEEGLKEAKESLCSLEANHKDLYQNTESLSTISMEAITEHGIEQESLTKAEQVLSVFTELFERKTVVPAPIEETMSEAKEMPEVPESVEVA
jgi:hypothetical protein